MISNFQKFIRLQFLIDIDMSIKDSNYCIILRLFVFYEFLLILEGLSWDLDYLSFFSYFLFFEEIHLLLPENKNIAVQIEFFTEQLIVWFRIGYTWY